jgi:hypothetical protein
MLKYIRETLEKQMPDQSKRHKLNNSRNLKHFLGHSLQHILNKIKHFTTILEHSLKNATQPILKSKNFIENSEMFNASKNY